MKKYMQQKPYVTFTFLIYENKKCEPAFIQQLPSFINCKTQIGYKYKGSAKVCESILKKSVDYMDNIEHNKEYCILCGFSKLWAIYALYHKNVS